MMLGVGWAGLANAAVTPPVVSLRAIPASTIPGMPVAFSATLAGTSEPVTVFAMELAVASTNETFIARGPNGEGLSSLSGPGLDRCEQVSCVKLLPDTSRQLWVGIDNSLSGNPFFSDRRLHRPGTYQLVLRLFGKTDGGANVVAESAPAALVVEALSGDDADAWNFMTASTPGGWLPVAGFLGVAERYPNSRYAAYAILTQANSAATDIAAIDRALTMSVPQIVKEHLLLAKAHVLHQRGDQALHLDGDLDAARSAYVQARAIYEELQKTATSPDVKDRAGEAKSAVYSRSSAIDRLRRSQRADSPVPLSVAPQLQCPSIPNQVSLGVRQVAETSAANAAQSASSRIGGRFWFRTHARSAEVFPARRTSSSRNASKCLRRNGANASSNTGWRHRSSSSANRASTRRTSHAACGSRSFISLSSSEASAVSEW